MAWWNKLVSNKALGEIVGMPLIKGSLAGTETLGNRAAAWMAKDFPKSRYPRMAGKAIDWGMGADWAGKRGRSGVIAGRLGAGVIGGGAVADFLNPWGLGWGD